MTELLLDDKISKEAYDEKYNEISIKINRAEKEWEMFAENTFSKQGINKRMKEIRTKLDNADIVDEFDRIVFESIVEKVIVGEKAEDGTVDSYKLTFVLKGMEPHFIPDAKNRYRIN